MKGTILFSFLTLKYITCIVVKVDEGELRGTTIKLSNDRTVYVFYGVPYADPPTGNNRFQPPASPKPWNGVRNASFGSNICLQFHQFTKSILGGEDCLYLNIFISKLPEAHGNSLMDVMVYLHGGSFMFGSGSNVLPDHIMENNNLVVVSVNYRLNIFGFLSTNDAIAPGNNGLKDQVAALKWIQKNIIYFGGNSNSVTLVGSSAGGASVHYHFLSPLSEGLFHRAISSGGTVLLPWTLPRNNSERSMQLATFVGCPTRDTNSMLECLKTIPARHLIEATKHFQVWRYYPFTVFGPVVEPSHPNAFISEEPRRLLEVGKVHNLPWLIGICKDEGLYPAADFIADESSLQELNEQWLKIAPHLLMYNFSVVSEVEKNKISADIRKYYFGDKTISKEIITEIVQLLGDRHFFNDIIEATRLHSAAVSRNIFCYFFSYRGKYSQANFLTNSTVDYGTSHADDIYYVISVLSLKFLTDETESDAAMAKYMSNVYRAFMKAEKPATLDKVWKPVSKKLNEEGLPCLNIRSSVSQEMINFENKRSTKFWRNSLPSEYVSRFKFLDERIPDEL